jgi:RNA polymerase sigma-70 factor (ECF subfamily)
LPDHGKIILLLEGCKKNNRSSQQELYHLLNSYAMGICLRYAENQQEAEELLQEGFMKLFRNIEKFETNRHADQLAALKGWFKRILINTCIDQFRKNRHNTMTYTITEEFDIPAVNQATAIDQLSYKELVDAIRLLSPGYRQVFNLFVIEGLSHEDIAEKLGISIGTSKSNLSKAREKMKKIILQLIRFKVYA